MSESIFETFTDERGNISVRVSREVTVLTSEEANRIEADYKRLVAENAKLRDLLKRTWDAFHNATAREFVRVKNELRELGVEVD